MMDIALAYAEPNLCTVTTIVFIFPSAICAFVFGNFILGSGWYLIGITSMLNHHRKYKEIDHLMKLDEICVKAVGCMNLIWLVHFGTWVNVLWYVSACCACVSLFKCNKWFANKLLSDTDLHVKQGFGMIHVLIHIIGGVSNIYILRTTIGFTNDNWIE